MAKSKEQYIAERTDDYELDLYSFSLIDENTVKRLRRDGEIELPARKINVPKDERWNTKQMGSKLLAGIMNGDSIPKIAQSLGEVIGNNSASAVRNARTMVTSAENHGRLDSYKNLDKQGVVQKKVWMATADDRTRASHIDIDGEEQDLDAPFTNGCMFPADGKGPAEEVWNCRCSMRTHIVGFRKADGSISPVNYERDRTIHDEQMDAEKQRRGVEPKVKEKPTFTFTPAKTKEEAERFILQYVNTSTFGALGVDYSGIDLEVQNTINKTISELQEEYNVPAFGGIKAPTKNTKEGKAISNATAAYSSIRDSFYLNRESLKTMSIAEKRLGEETNAIKDMYAHPEKYDLSKLGSIARRVIENGRESGRATVPQTVEEVIWHEYGHRLEKFIPKENLNECYARMDQFAGKISGYACENKSEYIAESFCCYNNGEKSKIDPLLAQVFDLMKK